VAQICRFSIDVRFGSNSEVGQRNLEVRFAPSTDIISVGRHFR